MPQRCTVCDHQKRAEIDAKLVAHADTFRGLARSYRLSKDALLRHYDAHLPAAMVKAEEVREALRSRNLTAELERCLERVHLLFDACDRWLRDPADATRYDIGPRAEDVSVTYWVTDEKSRRTRKKAKLSRLLAKLAGVAPGVELVETKHADPRELVLKTSEQLRAHMELLAKLKGQLQQEITVNVLITAEWQAVQTKLLSVLAPHPAIRIKVAQALEEMAHANRN